MSSNTATLRHVINARWGLRTTAIFSGRWPIVIQAPLRVTAKTEQLGWPGQTKTRSTYFLTALLDPKSRRLLWGAYCRYCLRGVPGSCRVCPDCKNEPDRVS